MTDDTIQSTDTEERTDTPVVYGFSRKSTGLTPAHVSLIKLLAQRAVKDYQIELTIQEEEEE